MWDVKTKLKPVITRAIGSISESFRKYLSKILGKQDIKGTTQNRHIRHCTPASENTDVQVQSIQRGK